MRAISFTAFRRGSLIVAALLLLAGCGGSGPEFSTEPAATGTGLASWYGEKFRGRPTASGEIFDPDQLTCAHKTLKFGTMVRVTRVDDGRSVVVRVNDRGPFVKGRIVDLSRAAARRMGMIAAGVVEVRLEVTAR